MITLILRDIRVLNVVARSSERKARAQPRVLRSPHTLWFSALVFSLEPVVFC